MHHSRLVLVLLCAVPSWVVVPAYSQQTLPSESKRDARVAQAVLRHAEIARPSEGETRERIMVDLASGTIECRIDDDATETRVTAEFMVDGRDAADAERRAKLAKLFTERAGDGTIVVDAVIPGTVLPADSVKVTIVAPPTDELVLKSASGTVRAKSGTGTLRTATKSGAIVIEGHRGPIDARAVSGRIDITGASESVQVTSVSGAVALALGDANDQPFNVESRSGAVRVEVGAEFDGVVTLTSSSGVLALLDTAKRARIPQATSTRKVVEIGAAAGQSKISTTSGAVTLVLRAKIVGSAPSGVGQASRGANQ
jgi:hypothetical protein